MAPRREFSDTSPAATRVLFDLYRRMTPAQKLRCVEDLTRSANTLALAGLRMRYPNATERELFLRLAVLRLGEDLVHRAYGWRPADDS